METVVKWAYRRRGQPGGAILLADGKTCKNVVCTRGAIVKDIIDEVCMQDKVQIVPIARPFFALCDPRTGIPLCSHHTLTQDEARKKYQLRVFVNTGENSFQFLRMSRAAYSYYYRQLREEFIGDRLYPRASVNTGIWMAAIDMARVAHEKNSEYGDIIRSQKDLRGFMPKFLKEKCAKERPVAAKLEDTFRKFKEIRETVGVDHYESKYVEVYEKDVRCGKHIFRLKNDDPDSRRHPTLAVVSSKDGIYKVRTGESGGTKVEVCSISALINIDVGTNTVILVIKKPEDTADTTDTTEQDSEEKQALHFYDKREAHSFAIIVHAYYQLLVNANEVILSGALAPQEEFLRVGCNPDDGKRVELCHAPIPPQYVSNTLTKNGMMSDGNFLIRESRNTDHAYTLSLCYRGKVMNYRIIHDQRTGYSFQDPQNENKEPSPSHQTFQTLTGLIAHHQETADGLPSALKMNYSPNVTGPIPLLKQPTGSNRPAHPGPINFSRPPVVTTDDESSMASTPSPHTPSSKLFDRSGRGIAATDLSSPASSFVSPLPRPVSPVEPEQLLLEEVHSSPFISELVAKGVRYIKYSSLKTSGELGSGHYSTVYLADWAAENRKVAIKIPTMKEHNVEDVKKDLMREILTMNTLDHPHVVQLLGISDTKHYLDYIGVIPVVIMEFVDGGCLRTFLNNFKRTVVPDMYSKKKTDFLLYGKQIAEGMSYLAQSKIVHRDLAARNVLMVTNDQIKISDFGLARKQLEDSDYYKSKGNSNDLPIYWYAPECLSSFKFTTKGDVWSYGVTLWEMFTLGDNPNAYLGPIVRQAHSAQMAFQALVDVFSRQNFRLPGLSCEKRVYNTIITKCWELDPQKRPSFDTLAKEMGDLYDMVVRVKTNAGGVAPPVQQGARELATAPRIVSPGEPSPPQQRHLATPPKSETLSPSTSPASATPPSIVSSSSPQPHPLETFSAVSSPNSAPGPVNSTPSFSMTTMPVPAVQSVPTLLNRFTNSSVPPPSAPTFPPHPPSHATVVN